MIPGEGGVRFASGQRVCHWIDGIGEVGEVVGDRLDPLVGQASRFKERTRLVEITGMDCGGEIRSGGDHRAALQDHVDLVLRQGADKGAGVRRLARSGCRTFRGDTQRAARVGQEPACECVLAWLELHVQCLAEAWCDVLALGQNQHAV